MPTSSDGLQPSSNQGLRYLLLTDQLLNLMQNVFPIGLCRLVCLVEGIRGVQGRLKRKPVKTADICVCIMCMCDAKSIMRSPPFLPLVYRHTLPKTK